MTTPLPQYLVKMENFKAKELMYGQTRYICSYPFAMTREEKPKWQRKSVTWQQSMDVAISTTLGFYQRDTIMTDDTELQSADDLFANHSIPDLRLMEKKTRADIESKRQELRLMVGERYRDLISAADAIVSMRKNALSVQDMLDKMQDSCNVNAIKRRASAMLPGRNKDVATEQRKRYLYTAAAQIKLLVDVPEQIWHALEQDHYLTAARLYLIAKVVYKNLQAEQEDMMFTVETTFPVVQRQWDAVSHFKTQIVQKSVQYLKVVEQSEQNVAETLCALMLLDDATVKDTFKRLLDMRTIALTELFTSSLATSGDQQTIIHKLAERLREIIEVIRRTLHHINAVYIRSADLPRPPETADAIGDVTPSRNLLEVYLDRLQRGFTIADDNPDPISAPATPATATTSNSFLLGAIVPPTPTTATRHSSISRLYAPATNIHLLVRYLPEPVQTFTPFLQLHGPRAVFTRDDVRKGTRNWVDQAAEVVAERLDTLLGNAAGAAQLVQVRAAVWEALVIDETDGRVQPNERGKGLGWEGGTGRERRSGVNFGTPRTPNMAQGPEETWMQLCTSLLGQPLSIWNNYLRPGFNHRFEILMREHLDRVACQPSDLLCHDVELLGIKPSSSDDLIEEDRHLGDFVWSPVVQNLATAGAGTTPVLFDTREFKGRIRRAVAVETRSVHRSLAGFDEAINRIREDQRAVLEKGIVWRGGEELGAEGEVGEDIFGVQSDTKRLRDSFKEECSRAMAQYREELAALLQSQLDSEIDPAIILVRSLLIGRVARAIANDSVELPKLFEDFTASTFGKSEVVSTLASGRPQGYTYSSLAFKQELDPRLVQARRTLLDLYIKSHIAWIDSQVERMSSDIYEMLHGSRWDDMAAQLIVWEAVSALDMTGKTEDVATGQIRLPAHVSTSIITALFGVCEELHRVGSATIDHIILRRLLRSISARVLAIYQAFLNEVADNDESTEDGVNDNRTISDKGALQLLFDVRFMRRVFEGAWKGRRAEAGIEETSKNGDDDDVELERKADEVIGLIKEKIDPINLAVFEPHLEANVERHYARNSILLGLLLQLNPRPAETRRKSLAIQEYYNTLPMAPQAPRFTLLPIGHKTGGRLTA
ncbi:hypothetical protein BC937DRAFT_91791 [Endogone sp. FLAS-F59071]|nr:hypothetical protein BC937DRAFT_91791 [Endogone sp. FLAS-F59071]|eukprot:RUS21705.1 hypothetical protein BC937DRAFT_91791 [Endogone sp. FLAS-F59071]